MNTHEVFANLRSLTGETFPAFLFVRYTDGGTVEELFATLDGGTLLREDVLRARIGGEAFDALGAELAAEGAELDQSRRAAYLASEPDTDAPDYGDYGDYEPID